MIGYLPNMSPKAHSASIPSKKFEGGQVCPPSRRELRISACSQKKTGEQGKPTQETINAGVGRYRYLLSYGCQKVLPPSARARSRRMQKTATRSIKLLGG
jgi:hypothetical protein